MDPLILNFDRSLRRVVSFTSRPRYLGASGTRKTEGRFVLLRPCRIHVRCTFVVRNPYVLGGRCADFCSPDLSRIDMICELCN
jgi:hypothetical protein